MLAGILPSVLQSIFLVWLVLLSHIPSCQPLYTVGQCNCPRVRRRMSMTLNSRLTFPKANESLKMSAIRRILRIFLNSFPCCFPVRYWKLWYSFVLHLITWHYVSEIQESNGFEQFIIRYINIIGMLHPVMSIRSASNNWSKDKSKLITSLTRSIFTFTSFSHLRG